jgi:hypothetical protein
MKIRLFNLGQRLLLKVLNNLEQTEYQFIYIYIYIDQICSLDCLCEEKDFFSIFLLDKLTTYIASFLGTPSTNSV